MYWQSTKVKTFCLFVCFFKLRIKTCLFPSVLSLTHFLFLTSVPGLKSLKLIYFYLNHFFKNGTITKKQ